MGELAAMGEAALDAQAAIASQDDRFKALLASAIPAMRRIMPSVATPQRAFQIYMECVRKNPQLRQCDPNGIVSCLMTCSALGLEPSAVDNLGRAYIIPRYNSKTGRQEATFELGYPGAIELAMRSGNVRDIRARAVHERDEFEYQLGTEEFLRHVPARRDPGELTHVYCVAVMADGSRHLEVMTKGDVDRRRRFSKAKGGPWADHYDEMAKKTVVLYTCKWLTKSAEVQLAMGADGTVPTLPGSDSEIGDRGDGDGYEYEG